MLRVLPLVVLSCCASSAMAGSSVGTVTKIWAHERDVVMFAAGLHSGEPSCRTKSDEWSVSLATASGKAMYALLLTAQAQGGSITVEGTQACTAWSDRETVRYIHLAQ